MKKATIFFIFVCACIPNLALSQVSGYTFTASNGTYISITGTVPVLTGDGINLTRDEGYANNIPLGFTFNYLGANYTTISASTNGFAAFGNIITPGFSNNIASGGNNRPLLAPFWEDIALAGVADLQYATIGSPGNRVFILQWGNVFADFAANDTSMSFQLRLYETTNLIEFVYSQLPGPVQDFSGGASIGITASTTGPGSFLSLNNSSIAPAAGSTIGTDTIKLIPASGQVYTFTPSACMAPGGLLAVTVSLTDASLAWADAGSTLYEYAVSTSSVPPLSGIPTSATATTVSNLTPGTQYYLHVRKDCAGNFSGWNSFRFVTVSDTASIPYMMPVSNTSPPALPVCTSVKDENQDGNTWRSRNSAGSGWTDQVMAYVYNINTTTPANDWLFTKPLRLVAGTNYRLTFKYNNDGSSIYPEKLKVAFGNSNTAAAMNNVMADYQVVSSAAPKIAIIDFTPSVSDIYYVGFQAYSDADKNVLILDDILIDLRPSCDMPDTLAALVTPSGTAATVSWMPPSYGIPAGYEFVVNNSPAPPASGTAIASSIATVNGLTPDMQYYLHVRSICDAAFSAWATLAFATVGNDNACNAMPVTAGSVQICADNTLATSLSDPRFNCSSPDHTLWYKYTATDDGTVLVNVTTPGGGSDPLHGWVGWFQGTGTCPDATMYSVGSCAEFGNNGNNDFDTSLSPPLIKNETYYLMIDGYSGDVGEFCLSIPGCSPAVAVNVNSILSTSATITWGGSGSFILEYGPTGFVPGTDANAGAGGTVINAAVSPFNLTGLSINASYDVYIRRSCAENVFSVNSAVVRFITSGAPPANDNCSGAIPLTVFDGVCGGATNGTTQYSTLSPTLPFPSCGDEPGGYDDDVWFKFTPTAGQLYVNIDFLYTGGYTDVTAQVYSSSDNSSSGTFSLLSCKDDGGPGSMPRFTGLPVLAGNTYFIRVFSDSINVNSQFTVCVTKGLPPNDNASGAIAIAVDAPCSGAIYTNVAATQSTGEPTGSCSSTTGYATVWYKFTAPSGGAVKITTATGSGNTLTNTRVGLFSATNEGDYATFNIIACDEDGGTGAFGEMSVLYATGLIPDNTYYIQVDKFDSNTPEGTFCLTVDKLRDTMLSVSSNCNTVYQTPVGSLPSYKGWVPLMDGAGKLIALVKNAAGAPANGYNVVQNINTGVVRKDIVSNEYYLNRSYSINNTTGNGVFSAQLFFLNTELNALNTVDPAATLTRLRITSQTAVGCKPDFIATNGVNSEIPQTGNGTSGGVSWITTNLNGYSNVYVHAVKSYLDAKVFLQGAYDANLGRHKDVTPTWANVLNTYAKNQPYNTIPYADTAHEGFGATTAGGRGMPVYHVTNLNATGPGSLFAALGNNRTVVFDVAGPINKFSWYGSTVINLTIDGSTAPSPGITLYDDEIGNCITFDDLSHDIIVKNIRVRNAGNDGIGVINSYNILFDHISVSGSGDGDLDITDGSNNITVQWSILGTGKQYWSGAMLIAYPGTRDISLHHNLYTSSGSGTGERNPFVHNATDYIPNPVDYLMADFTNNIVWKWGNSNGGSGYGSGVDYGGTLQARNNFYQSPVYTSNAIVVNPNSTGAKLYASGNISGNTGINPNIPGNVASPWSVAAVTTQDVCSAAAMVLDRAGSRPLDETDQGFVNSVSIANCQGFTNQPPVVNGSANVTMTLPANSTVLSGSATDDDGTIASYAWSKVNGGPATFTIESPNTPTTTISNLVAGTYTFRLTVKDNDGGTTTDDIKVIVVNSGTNQSPDANAGNTITMTSPVNSAMLNGSGSDNDGTVNFYSWSKVSGPAGTNLTVTNTASVMASNLIAGTYVFRLTVTDNSGATGTDNVNVIVDPAPSANPASYGSYAGSEKVSTGFFTSTPATTDIIDWVMLEIKNVSGSIVARRAAFVREDGKIVDLDGISPVAFYGLANGNNYLLTIRHRNHLGIRTSTLQTLNSVAMGVTSNISNYDFTSAQNKAFQNPAITTNAAMKDLGGGVFGMWAGNANGNSTIRASGVNSNLNDFLQLVNSVLNGNAAVIMNNVYNNSDLNMDGTVRASGFNASLNDFLFLVNSVLTGNNALIFTEHR